MRTKIVLISQGVSFMGNSIQKNLESAGYDVIRVDPEVKQLVEYKDETELFVFYLGKFVSEIPETLVYLKDICLEEEKFLFLLGTLDELDVATQYIPPAAI
ncbi:MAG: hypothetical protein IJ797_07235, partial [Selenomonadaceae bacterium]|nr:hypothetical protein [Selenomonadaceae bacterium]